MGRRAERAVAEYLAARGYAIVAVNLRLGHLEIDVLARDAATIVVVEVRLRGERAWQKALASINTQKRKRLRRAANRLWRDRYRFDSSVQRLRFDAAGVRFSPDGQAQIDYVRAAF